MWCSRTVVAVVTVVIALGIAVDATGQVTDAERNALIALYDSTNGPEWEDSEGWLGEPGTECSWNGVFCDGLPPGSSYVAGVFLGSNNLSGTIPPEIDGLARCTSLFLADNAITAPLPAAIGNLPALESLELQDNAIGGAIPSEIGNLANLIHLDLSNNDFSGLIPAAIGGLTNLRSLLLWQNPLTGAIPPEIGGLSSLEALALDETNLGGAIPPQMGDLENLEFLSLRDCSFDGPIPAELTGLQNLEHLYLGGNRLSGVIPDGFGDLPSLRWIQLDANALEGPIPADFANLGSGSESRWHVGLLYNKLWTDDPAVLSVLAVLSSGWDRYQTMPPERLAALVVDDSTIRLRFFAPHAMSDSDCMDVYAAPHPGGPYTLVAQNLPMDTALLDITGFDTAVPHWFAVTHTSPPHSQNQNTLVSVASREVTAPLLGQPTTQHAALVELFDATGGDRWLDPDGWLGPKGSECSWDGISCEESNVTEIYLGRRGLSGDLPDVLGHFSELQYLDLERNDLTGRIPRALCGLSHLRYLELRENELSGAPPECLWSMETLRVLWLSDNQLTGGLPTSLAGLGSLETLDLSRNSFGGWLPPSIGSLGALSTLRLAGNRFTGVLPPEIGQLGELDFLDIEANAFQGSIPEEILDAGPGTRLTVKSDHNALWTDDPAVGDLFGDFELTQTTAPNDPVVVGVGDHTAWLAWTPMPYQSDPGGYELCWAPRGSSAFARAGLTPTKASTRFPVTGLPADQAVDIHVLGVTMPHPANGNRVVSEPSDVVIATTTSIGCPMPMITVSGDGPSVDLTVSGVFTSVEWSTGETTPTISVVPDPAVWYWARALGPGVCDESAVIEFASVFLDGFEGGTLGAWSLVADE